ncbi:hypothetical protein [Pseudokineococcus sp. 1T1Z-3]|uniref:hypothetical protein n=1 Tax=Pseudokineococcus sp. 1T1Z-3 TaxID=3132745 RepID=UPI0030A46EBF
MRFATSSKDLVGVLAALVELLDWDADRAAAPAGPRSRSTAAARRLSCVVDTRGQLGRVPQDYRHSFDTR